jgi:TonB family protein
VSQASAVGLVVTLAFSLAATGAAAQPVPAVEAFASPVLRLGVHGASASAWRVRGGTADIETGAMVLRGRPGWIGGHQPLADFVLSFEARLDGPEARAGVVVRAWPTFDRDTGVVTNAYRVVLAAGDGAGQVIHHRFEEGAALASDPPGDTPATFPGAWHAYRIEATGSILSTSVDGRLLSTVRDVQNPQGFIAFVAERGLAEIRNVSIEPSVRVVRQPHRDAASTSDPAISPPAVLYDAKPQYTAAAMRARIQGRVLVSGVVDVDGRLHDARLLLSLDPTLGLDSEAMAAVAQWRFVPGTRDGRPVRVTVTIEVSFNLK